MVARSKDDKGFLSRWSERKRDSQQAPEEADPLENTAAVDSGAPRDSSSDAAAPTAEEPAFNIDDLPDVDSLEEGADFSVFMHEKVPEALRRRALRRLWRVDPAFSFLDGMNDYDEDYTDAAMVVEGLKTVYQVGKGMLVEEEETEATEDGAPVQDEVVAAPGDEGQPAIAEDGERGIGSEQPGGDETDDPPPEDALSGPSGLSQTVVPEGPDAAAVPAPKRSCGPSRKAGRSAISRRWGDSGS